MRTRTAIALMLACALPLAAQRRRQERGRKWPATTPTRSPPCRPTWATSRSSSSTTRPPSTSRTSSTSRRRASTTGRCFHRVIPGFMIQGGDPQHEEAGGPRRTPYGTGGNGDASGSRPSSTTRSHKRGIVSMARSSDPNSASSQFFIVVKDSNFLDGQYSAFGEVDLRAWTSPTRSPPRRAARTTGRTSRSTSRRSSSRRRRARARVDAVRLPTPAGLEALAASTRRSAPVSRSSRSPATSGGAATSASTSATTGPSSASSIPPRRTDSRRRWVAARDAARGPRARARAARRRRRGETRSWRTSEPTTSRRARAARAGERDAWLARAADAAAAIAAIAGSRASTLRSTRRSSGASSISRARPSSTSSSPGRSRAAERAAHDALGGRARARDPRAPRGALPPRLPRATISSPPASDVAVIDFQDLRRGPDTYDLASLLWERTTLDWMTDGPPARPSWRVSPPAAGVDADALGGAAAPRPPPARLEGLRHLRPGGRRSGGASLPALPAGRARARPPPARRLARGPGVSARCSRPAAAPVC